MTTRFYTALGLGVVHGTIIGILIAIALGLLGCQPDAPPTTETVGDDGIQQILALETADERKKRLDRLMRLSLREAFRLWSEHKIQAGADAYADACLMEYEIINEYGWIWDKTGIYTDIVDEAMRTYEGNTIALDGITKGLNALTDVLKEIHPDESN